MGIDQVQDINGVNGRPLKICLLTYRGKPTCGGQGVYIKRISRALKDLGHHPSVVSGPPYPELDGDIPLYRLPSLDLYNPDDLFRIPKIRELRSMINTLEWLGVSTGGFPEPLTFSLRAYLFFKENTHNFDIIHDNQCLSYGLLGIQRLGYPLVATIHHPITVDRNTEIEDAGWFWQRWKVRRWYSFLNMQVRVARRFSHIVTVSERSRKDIAEEFDIEADRIQVVSNGINTETFHPMPHIKREDSHLMVTSSAETPLKGLRFLLKAVASIARQRPVKLTVVGTPKPDGDILRYVKKKGISDIVEFTGWIEDKEITALYARCAIAIVPSLYEGFGFPAGEAMACGTPVISTLGGALPEVIGDTGVLVPPADADALEKAILSLLDDPEKREKMSKAGYERIHKYFTWKGAAQSLVEIYREAINDNGRFLKAQS